MLILLLSQDPVIKWQVPKWHQLKAKISSVSYNLWSSHVPSNATLNTMFVFKTDCKTHSYSVLLINSGIFEIICGMHLY